MTADPDTDVNISRFSLNYTHSMTDDAL